MNGKKAKKLRRMAEKMTVGKPEKGYMRQGTTIVLIPGTTRSVYQKLKKRI